jgi:hypothetical protein
MPPFTRTSRTEAERQAAIRKTAAELGGNPNLDVRSVAENATQAYFEALRKISSRQKSAEEASLAIDRVRVLAEGHGINLETALYLRAEADRLQNPAREFISQAVLALAPATVLACSLSLGIASEIPLSFRTRFSVAIFGLSLLLLGIRIILNTRLVGWRHRISGALGGSLTGAALIAMVLFGSGSGSAVDLSIDEIAQVRATDLSLASMKARHKYGSFTDVTSTLTLGPSSDVAEVSTETKSADGVRYAMQVNGHRLIADLKPTSGVLFCAVPDRHEQNSLRRLLLRIFGRNNSSPERLNYALGSVVQATNNEVVVSRSDSRTPLSLNFTQPSMRFSLGEEVVVAFEPSRNTLVDVGRIR